MERSLMRLAIPEGLAFEDVSVLQANPGAGGVH